MKRRIRESRRPSRTPATSGTTGTDLQQNAGAMGARTAPAVESSAPSIDSERRDLGLDAEVASLAYAIWLGRGRPEGTDREDWFEAERGCEAGCPP